MPKSQRPSAVEANDVAEVVQADASPLDGDEFLAANRASRERLRAEAEQKADRKGERKADKGSARDRVPGKVETGSSRSTSRTVRTALIGLSVLVLILAASTAYFAYGMVQADRRAEASGPSGADRQKAMDLARTYASSLATYDPADYGDLDRRIREISTPDFAKTYITSSQDARRGNADARGTSRAESKDAGLQSMTDGKAVVLVTLDQTVTSPEVNSQVPEGIPYQSRVKVTLEKRDGRWLLSDFDTV